MDGDFMKNTIAKLSPSILQPKERVAAKSLDCKDRGDCIPGHTDFGITASLPSPSDKISAYKDLDKVKELGTTWIRCGFPAGDLIKEWRDENWTVLLDQMMLAEFEKFLQKAKSYNLKICFMVVEGYQGDVSYSFYIQKMKEYWGLIAQRLAKYIDVWQVFNEADGVHYRHYYPVDELSAHEQNLYYKELASSINTCRTIVHKYNPSTLITTNLYGYPINDEMEARWNNGLNYLNTSLDVITIDAYPQFNEEEIELLPVRLKRLQTKYKKNIMIGEIGLQTCPTCFSEQDQANILKTYVERLDSSYIDTIFLYTLRNWEEEDTGEGSFGLLNYNWTPKKSWTSVKEALLKHKSYNL